MSNPYLSYYLNQSGSGISGFTGTRLQRGHGWFGRLFSSVLPVLKYLGKQALTTGVSVAQDTLQGENIKQSLKRRAADMGANIAGDIAERAREYSQKGSGYRRKRRKRKNSILFRLPVKKRKVNKRRKRTNKKTHSKKKKTNIF